MVYMYHSFLIHSSADGHLGCFHVLAMINSAVMNTGVHMSLSDLVSLVCMPRSGIAGSYGSSVPSFLKKWLLSRSLQAINAGEENNAGEKGTLLHCWWECKLVQPLWKTVWRFLKKTGNRTSISPSNPTSGHTHQGNQI